MSQSGSTRRILALIGAVGALGLVTLFISCSSSATLDQVGKGTDALRRTQPAAGGTESIPPETEQAIHRFLSLFEYFDAETVGAAVGTTYSPDAYFNDGFVEVEGSAAISSYLAETAEAASGLEVDVEDQVLANGEVYLRWVMRFTTSGRRSRTIIAPGVTHLRFNDDGLIVYHRDYWDATGALAELVPFVGSVMRSVRTRLQPE